MSVLYIRCNFLFICFLLLCFAFAFAFAFAFTFAFAFAFAFTFAFTFAFAFAFVVFSQIFHSKENSLSSYHFYHLHHLYHSHVTEEMKQKFGFQNLRTFLIMPIQRILRYNLLLMVMNGVCNV
jgi:hypothetical protein